MKTVLTTFALLSTLAVATAVAQPEPAEGAPACPDPDCAPPVATPTATPTAAPAAAPEATPAVAYADPTRVTYAPAQPAPAPGVGDDQEGWRAPTGRRLLHGFRIGYNYVFNYNEETRDGEMSIRDEFGLKTPHSMVLGYEVFYRMVGHDWLNVLLVGNVSVAGLEQSKFIPAASGLIGFEFDQSFQLGVGVNLTPDPQSPTHMIAAAGWTPRAGGMYTPVHFYFIPDTESNHRAGVTVGVTW